MVDDSAYLVRLVELDINHVAIREDDAISWPSVVGDARMPRVDGVLTLYDVGDKASFEDVPEMLSKSSFVKCYECRTLILLVRRRHR